MKFKLIFVVGCVSVFLAGCSKSGCTNPCASNYDPEANSDNGLCIGCMNPLADTYCPELFLHEESDCECSGDGFLRFQNQSSYSTYQCLINGFSAGIITPGEEKTFRRSIGQYEVAFFNPVTQELWNTALVYITECERITGTCSN